MFYWLGFMLVLDVVLYVSLSVVLVVLMGYIVFLFPQVTGGWVSLGIVCMLAVLSLVRLLFPPRLQVCKYYFNLFLLIYNKLHNNLNIYFICRNLLHTFAFKHIDTQY